MTKITNIEGNHFAFPLEALSSIQQNLIINSDGLSMGLASFKARRIFCAPPVHYDVVTGDNALQDDGHAKYQIDPVVNRARLLFSWQKVADELIRLGHELLIPELDPHAPDQVFAADGIVHFINKEGKHCVLLSNMNAPARQLEVASAEKLFRGLGYEIYSADSKYKHEGTGDGLYSVDVGAIFTGYGPRTDRQAGQHLANVLGKTVFALPLTSDFVDDKIDGDAGGLRSKDIEGFHLEVLAQPLPTGHVICFEEGLPHFALQAFSFFYDGLFNEETRQFYSKLIKITKDDYERFATNCFAVPDKDAPNGYTLFIPEDLSAKLKDKLSNLGYRLFDVDIEVARWSGGGLHCMFNVEYDFSYPSPRNLNYVQEFILDKWSNSPDWDQGNRRAVPGLRAYRPQMSPDYANITHLTPV